MTEPNFGAGERLVLELATRLARQRGNLAPEFDPAQFVSLRLNLLIEAAHEPLGELLASVANNLVGVALGVYRVGREQMSEQEEYRFVAEFLTALARDDDPPQQPSLRSV